MNEPLTSPRDLLRTFLQAELELVPTFIGMAHKFFFLDDRKAAFESMYRADEALNTVERFAEELPMAESPAILRTAAELRASMELVRQLAPQ